MELQAHTGLRYIKRFLQNNSFDFKALDRMCFKSWLMREIERRQNDAVFSQRCKIRDIKKKYAKRLKALEKRLLKAKKFWQACGDREHIERLEIDISNAHKAITGLSQALKQRGGEKRKACKEKLNAFKRRLDLLQQELSKALQKNPEKESLEQARRALENYENSIGISENEELLKKMFVKHGHDATRAGSSFEKAVEKIVAGKIVPFLLKGSKIAKSQREREIFVLSQVMLGCARAELDYVVVRRRSPQKPVTVLAVIEVKRNLNDVASGFETRQENLAWFTGDNSGYDPGLYRTKVFRSGHFDTPARHKQRGESFLFARKSFVYFHRSSTGYFLNRLFFIAKRRFLQGLRSSEYSRLLYRISVDMRFDLQNDIYLDDLLSQLQTMVSPFQTRDVLELYSATYKTGQHFYFVE